MPSSTRRPACSPSRATTTPASPTSWPGRRGRARHVLRVLRQPAGDPAGALTRPITDTRERRPILKSQKLADRIRAEIFWYLSDHVEHLDLSKVWHAASNFDPEIAETRHRERDRRIERVRKGIESAEARARTSTPGIAAAALVAMLEEFTPLVHRGRRPGKSATTW